MTDASYHLFRPKARTTSVVFSSPHSGRDYPKAFLKGSILDDLTLRSSEDAFVDLLFSDVPALGAPLLTASAPRAYVDLNRSRDELDPAIVEGVRRGGHNPRVSAGLGVIPRVVSGGRAIRRGKISRVDAESRLSRYWDSYHGALQGLLGESLDRFGQAVLVDCHSMPREAIANVKVNGHQPDVVLGDRFGASAARDVLERVEAAFVGAGLRVARNAPFAGGHITQHYGRPSRRQHAIQIEINRALYMYETTVQPRRDFDDFKRLIATVAAEIVRIGQADLPLAAE